MERLGLSKAAIGRNRRQPLACTAAWLLLGAQHPPIGENGIRDAPTALAAGCSRACDKQWQHVCAARDERVRRVEMFPQLSLPDE